VEPNGRHIFAIGIPIVLILLLVVVVLVKLFDWDRPTPSSPHPPPPQKAWLSVNTSPQHAKVKILNIEPRYYRGMELEPGSYHLEVSAQGYQTQKRWIDLRAGQTEPINFQLVKEISTDPSQEARKNWLSQNYDAALISFNKIINQGGNLAAKRLAKKRLQWLGGYRGRIIFADDFEDGTIQKERWILHPPGPGGVEGKMLLMQKNNNFYIEGHGHYHAAARSKNNVFPEACEIQMRLYPVTLNQGGININTTLDQSGRFTISFNFRERFVNIWEPGFHSQEKKEVFQSRWYSFRAMINQRSVRVFLDGREIYLYHSRTSPPLLRNLNIESWGGTVRFDDVLIIRG
jgi:hypothetical protein